MQNIILIYDEIELTTLLKVVLSFEGFEVSEAHDGEAGLAAINSDIDLIRLDVMLPKLNGRETL
ncbi:response regulator, partial [Vibrio parahaemolyticus]